MIRSIKADSIDALRSMRAQPGWTAILVGVLAAGIALTVASFLLVDTILFRPLGIERQDRVLRLGRTDETREWMNSSSWPLVERFAAINGVFEGVAAEGSLDALHLRLSDGTRERLTGRAVTGEYFSLLGVQMQLGRPLRTQDDRAGAAPAVVVSHRFWRKRLGGSPDAIGQVMHVNSTAYTVVGVAAPGFRGMSVEALDIWLPARVAMRPESLWTDSGYNAFEVFARLREDSSAGQADAAVDAAVAGFGREESGKHAMAVPVTRFGNFVRDTDEVRSSTLLSAGALCILLLATVNAAGLLLVRAERRRGELALRASLGASRARLVTQQWVGAAVPVAFACVIGTILGLMVATLVIDSSAAQAVFGVSSGEFPSGARSMALAAAVMLACSLACALPAMLRAGDAQLSAQLAGGLGSGQRVGRRWYSGRALVVVQFALTLAVASAGAVFVDRFLEQWRAPVGSVSTDALVMAMDYGPVHSKSEASLDAANGNLLEKLRGTGEFDAVAVGGMVPIASNSMSTSMSTPAPTGEWITLQSLYNPVHSEFFRALGVPLVEGRAFDSRDTSTSPRVAIVPAATAARLWPGQSALGRTLRFEVGTDAAPIDASIVGVAADVRYRSAGDGVPHMVYVPAPQRHFGAALHVVVAPKPGMSEAKLSRILQHAATLVEPERAPGEVESVRNRIAVAVAGPAFLAAIATTFSSLAVLLAATGIYGAFSYLVASRKRDLAIRMAIGSSPRALFRLVLSDAALLITIGVVLGVLASLGLAKTAIATNVLPMAMTDASFIAIGIAVCAAGVLAVLPAARAAAATDVQSALRADG